MPTLETPHRASEKIDQVIDRLNAKWNLQIPRLHGNDAEKGGKGHELSRKCSSRIRVLCWKGTVDIASIMDDFDEVAAQKHSEWVFKPSQQSGTLPRVTKSWLMQDAISRSRDFSPQERSMLHKILYDLLDEEYKLISESDSYSRTSFATTTSTTTTAATSAHTSFTSSRSTLKTSFATAPDGHEGNTITQYAKATMSKKKAPVRPLSPKKREAAAAPVPTMSAKRAKINPSCPHQTSKLSKGGQQLNVYQSFGRRSDHTIQRHSSPPRANLQRSFETVDSGDLNDTFSDNGDEELSSNNTSLLTTEDVKDSSRESHFSGGTQLENVLLESFEGRKLMEDSHTTVRRRPQELLVELPHNGPFRAVNRQLPQHLPYWLVFEFYRVSQHFGIDVGFLYHKMSTTCDVHQLTFDTFWQAVITLCNNEKPLPYPQRSDLKDWTTRENAYADNASGTSVSLSGNLVFSRDLTKQIFDFKLNPVNNEKSCRFHRNFGADRFLVLDVPYFEEQSLLPKVKELFKGESLHDQMFHWLATSNHHIAGRTWKMFFAEPKDQSKKKRKEEGMRQRIHLFAVDGFDFAFSKLSPISLENFLNWHLTFVDNRSSTDLKLFARIQLGLSKTKPTLTLEPHEFVHVVDTKARKLDGSEVGGGIIMTDGCALISYKFALAVWQRYGKDTDLPSAFQGRISGAKGLWIVDYNNNHPDASDRGWWIEVADSQLKINPHPCQRVGADETQRTFEIVKTSSPCSPGSLNVQLITILEANGVPRLPLAAAARNEFAEYRRSFNEAMGSVTALRTWLQVYHNTSRSNGGATWSRGMPDGRAEELVLMLESGFHPRKCEYMTKRLKGLIKIGLTAYVDKLKIELPHSTNTFCIPDPLGVLKPGEVQLNFSQPWRHPVSGFSEMHFDDLKVLVARNPAHLRSDIQAVQFRFYPELRHLKDVMIFSTQGDFPLAGKLSGGDYDGDTVTAIWDPAFTTTFHNEEVPKLPSKFTCGIVAENQHVGEIFTGITPSADQANSFIRKCCSFNGRTNKLGDVTSVFERLVYASPKNLDTIDAMKLAALAGYLVDSSKQGDFVDNITWNKMKSSIEKQYKPLEKPAFRDDDPKPCRYKKWCYNVVDHLKFDVAESEKEDMLAEYNKTWALKPTYDDDLKQLCDHEWDRASRLPSSERIALEAVLKDLRRQMESLRQDWKDGCGTDENANTSDEFLKLVNKLYERLNSIEPLDVDCDVRREFVRDGGGKGTRWSLLRASCLYYTLPAYLIMPWKIAGDELCRMKARKHAGRTREVIQQVHELMKIDTKKQRRFADTEENEVVVNGDIV